MNAGFSSYEIVTTPVAGQPRTGDIHLDNLDLFVDGSTLAILISKSAHSSPRSIGICASEFALPQDLWSWNGLFEQRRMAD